MHLRLGCFLIGFSGASVTKYRNFKNVERGVAVQDHWWVYLIETVKGRIYTGISTNVERRFREHTRMSVEGKGPGAKYFRQDRPLKIAWREPYTNRSEASKREYQIKALPRARKLALIAAGSDSKPPILE